MQIKEIVKEIKRLNALLLENKNFPKTCFHCGEGQIPETLLDYIFCPDCNQNYFE